LIHIPLVVAGPGAFSSQTAVSLSSLPALLAGALQIAEHPWGPHGDVDDLVVSEYGSLGSRDAPGVAEWAAEWGLDDDAIVRLTSGGVAATDGSMKLVREHGTDRLYDVRADPLEMNPLDPMQVNGTFARLKLALEKTEKLKPVVSARRPSGNAEGNAEENAELEERLKLLGYL
jgi:hypothetical protein